ncbi:hypothetical protein [Thiocapsa bogorovii]|uniref:hypothetical protein n=1 Tax=Thiocapsa bogorovii TaxID=521689 RepID=UPI001E37321E|nr:hypothetical protein [Thiocapsa bogorovii]UHD18648.1 hypothetical protein LT988_11700 [Thiocapsa bogorovii]
MTGLITRSLVAALLVSTTALAGGIHTQRVHFAKGADSATIEGRIQGDMTIDYLLGARQGQSMNVSMATDNGANTFNTIAPGKENDFFAHPADVAESVCFLTQQPRSAWTVELDLRPFGETW